MFHLWKKDQHKSTLLQKIERDNNAEDVHNTILATKHGSNISNIFLSFHTDKHSSQGFSPCDEIKNIT